MKRIIASLILVLGFTMAWAGSKEWKKADVVAAYEDYLSIGRVTFADTATIVEVIATRPGTNFRFSKDTYLDCGDGKHYMVMSCKEFPLEAWVPGEGPEVRLTFLFEPMPKSTKVFDLMEGQGSGMFRIYGIHDSRKPLKVKPYVCKDNAMADYRKNFFRTGTACVKGRFEELPGDRTGIIYHEYHFADKSLPVSVDVNDDGTFEREFEVWHPVLNHVTFDGMSVPFYVEPGHTVNILIRKDGRVEYTDENGHPAPCAAYLSSNIDDIRYLTWSEFKEDTERLSFKEYGKKIEGLMEKAEANLSYFANRYGFTSLDYAVARTEMLENLSVWFLDYEMDKRYSQTDSSTKAELNDLSNYQVLRRMPSDDPLMLACPSFHILQNRYSYTKAIWHASTFVFERNEEGEIVSHSYNKPEVRDSLFADIDRRLFGQDKMSMLAKVNLLNTFKRNDLGTMITFQPNVTEEMKARFLAQHEEKNRQAVLRLKGLIGDEAFSGHIDRIYQHYLDTKDYTYSLPEGEGTTILRKITDAFRGRYVFLDFWATSCGPCRAGIEQTREVREAMKDNPEVVFLFLTNDRESPEGDYEDYVEKNLKGEHVYRLPQSEYIKLRELFQFNGIPHYEILDKKGNVIRDPAHYSSLNSFNILLEEIKEMAE